MWLRSPTESSTSSPTRKPLLSPSNIPFSKALTHASPRALVRSYFLICLALLASTFCAWTVFSWFQRVHHEFDVLRAQRDNALATDRSKEIEAIAKLKDQHEKQLEHFQHQVDSLNATNFGAGGTTFGYDNFPDGQLQPVGSLSMDDVVVIIKTGATEAVRALSVHLATTLLHTPNYLFFSDAEQYIGGYHIQDALDSLDKSIIGDNDDWKLYQNQKKYIALGQSPEKLELKGGWELDRYKNVPMMVKAWKQRPNAKWYIFIDADSYLMMNNLVQYLSGLDHNKKLYLGAIAYVRDLPFGHGGTGYVLSHGTVKHVMDKTPDIEKKYQQHSKENCCGDYVLSRALKDHGIELTPADPNFQGRPQYKVELDKARYCEPMVTLHHLNPQDVGPVWELEKKIAVPGQYILHADVFEHFVYPYLQPERTEWDCMSHDKGQIIELPKDTWLGKDKKTELEGAERRQRTWETCKKICEGKSDCVMFRTWKDECKTDWHLALGYKVPVTDPDEIEFHSGWIMDRVEEIRSDRPCKQPGKDWPKKKLKWA